jgi:peptide/nickel transport system substrate-binding protein
MLTLLTVFALLAGCGPQATEEPTAAPTEPPAEEPTEAPPAEEEAFQVGMVTDVGGIDDKSFNQTSWDGMQMAADELGVTVDFLESQQQTDYAPNITQFLEQDYNMVVTVGFLLADATYTFAQENPDTNFAIVDFGWAPGYWSEEDNPRLDNLQGLLFSTDQAAFLAGYVAAGMTETGAVGTFGGIEIPTVTIFMDAYAAGVEYYNEQNGTDVQVLGTDVFVGNFESTEDGRRVGEDLIAEGADIIMPVAGPVGLGTAAAVQANPGTKLIGVDTDWCVSAPEYCDVTLTSVMKNMDVAVFNAIQQAQSGSFQGGSNFVGTLDNEGVGIAPFNEFEDEVPQELKDALDEVRQGIMDGSIDTGASLTVAPEPEEEEAMAPEDVEPLVIGTTDSVTDLDPANSYDFHTWEIHHNTMDTLLHYVPGTTELEPGLAESYEVSDDGLQYTFKLREGLSFPDGEPFNAEAVAWSINRVMRLEGDPSWLATSFVDTIEAVDEYTVRVTLQNPVGFFPLVVATQPWSIVSPECYPEDDFDIDSTCGGIGPYLINSWERDVEMDLVANPDYYAPPEYPHILVRYFADSTAMRLALEAGDIDMAWKTLTPSDYSDFEDNPDYNLMTGPGAYIRYICFNATTPPFDSPTVRQAISYAIDRDQISEVVYQGTHENLYSMVPMGMEGHIDAFPERDLDQARALLAEAGFDEDNPLVMDFWWTPSHYGPTEGDVASAMKQALEETGVIQVNLQSAEWATYTDYFGPGTMPTFLLGWYPDYLDPDNYLWSFAHSDASEDLGIFYSDEEMDSLLVEAQTETDPDTRMELYADIQELWTEEAPTIPFTQGQLLVVTQPGVEGVELDPTMFMHYFTLSK